MKLDAARIVLRPRSLVEILDLALKFCSGPAFKLYAKLGALTLLPAWALACAAHWFLLMEWVEVWLIALALVTPIQGVFTVAVGRLMFAEDVTVREVLGQFIRRFPAYLGALIATRIIIGIAGLLFFFPAFWAWGRSTYVHEACLLEQADSIESVRRASRMVANNVVNAIGLLLLLSLAACGFVFCAEILVNTGLLDFLLQVGKPFGELLTDGGSAASLLGLFLVVPLWSTARFLAYIDQRTRRDGWDIQLKFMAIAAAERDETGAPGVAA